MHLAQKRTNYISKLTGMIILMNNKGLMNLMNNECHCGVNKDNLQIIKKGINI